MVDEADRILAMDELQLENALQHHARRARSTGRATCENLDCGEAISPQRQDMGARLCVPCAKADEAQRTHARAWRR